MIKKPKINIENGKEYRRFIQPYPVLLSKRYEQCDSRGHLNKKGERCLYCYRHLAYHAPQTEAILRQRESLPLMKQSLDAQLIMLGREREIGSQKTVDYFQGINKLIAEAEKYPAVAKEIERIRKSLSKEK